MNATNYAAAGVASLDSLEYKPRSALDSSEFCRNPVGKNWPRLPLVYWSLEKWH